MATMIRISQALSRDYLVALRGRFAKQLANWWADRFPWFSAQLGDGELGDRALATALHVIDESEALGFDHQDEIMSYSIGYLCLGSRFCENVLYKHLMSRCYWHAGVDRSLKLVRVVEHVDMFMWDKILTAERGCLHGLPDDEAMAQLEGASLDGLGDALEQLARHRLPVIDVDQLGPYSASLAADLAARGVPERHYLFGAVLGVFVGASYLRSPAYAWIGDTLRSGEVSQIMEVLRG